DRSHGDDVGGVERVGCGRRGLRLLDGWLRARRRRRDERRECDREQRNASRSHEASGDRTYASMRAIMFYGIGRSLIAPALRTSAPLVAIALGAALVVPAHGASAIRYRLTFPQPEHRWMQVEASFSDLPPQTLELRMSRSSPGRYSLHDFAKNVYDVHVVDADGRELTTTRPDPYGWNVERHGAAVTVKYKVYGDRIDGTYLAIDRTHAHINMPAAIMWAHGLDDRPVAVTF